MSTSAVSSSASSVLIPRKYAFTSLATGSGKYLLLSNDAEYGYLLCSYVEDGDLFREMMDGTTEPVVGKFWRVLLVKPSSGLLTYQDGVVTGCDVDRLLDAASLVDGPHTMVLCELLTSRKEAVQEAFRRFQVRRQDNGSWAVYDRNKQSWPAILDGHVFPASVEREPVDDLADRLNRNHA